MEKRSLTLLAVIVILGSVLRMVGLADNPPSLNWDEVSHGYNAYSILKTGHDEWGQKYPLINFRAYGDYPTPLNLYLTVPFIAAFGLSEFSIRLPHAILGVLSITSVYFLIWGVSRRKDLALLSAFLASVSPWYVFTSRFVLQSNLSVFLLITSMAFFFNRDKNRSFFDISIFLLFLTLFSYHTTRIFSPLLLLVLFFNFWPEFKKKIIVFGIFIIVSLVILLNPTARARGSVLFLLDNAAIGKIEQQRNASSLPKVIRRLVYNRPVYFLKQFTTNYLSYYSPNFLFIKGGTQYQFSIPDRGLIYLICLPLFYFGLLVLFNKSYKNPDNALQKNYRLILFWLLLYPIPASLTNEKFAVIRATTLLPVSEFVVALGLFEILEKLKNQKTLILASFCIAILLSLDGYLTNYFGSYKTNYSWSWQFGYKAVSVFVEENYSKYNKIIITKKYGEPHEFLLFYSKWDPAKYQNDPNLNRFYQSNWYWVDGFDKFYFVNDWEVSKYNDKFVLESKKTVTCSDKVDNCLLITSPGNNPVGWRKIKSIDFLDGKTAFEIYEKN